MGRGLSVNLHCMKVSIMKVSIQHKANIVRRVRLFFFHFLEEVEERTVC